MSNYQMLQLSPKKDPKGMAIAPSFTRILLVSMILNTIEIGKPGRKELGIPATWPALPVKIQDLQCIGSSLWWPSENAEMFRSTNTIHLSMELTDLRIDISAKYGHDHFVSIPFHVHHGWRVMHFNWKAHNSKWYLTLWSINRRYLVIQLLEKYITNTPLICCWQMEWNFHRFEW